MTLTLKKYIISRIIPAHMDIFIDNGTVSQSIPSGVGWTKLLFSDLQTNQKKHMELDSVNRQIKILKKGIYTVTLTFYSITNSSGSLNLETALFKNGERLPYANIKRQFQGVSLISGGTISCQVSCNKNDIIDTRTRHDKGSVISVTTQFANLKAQKI